MIDIQMVGKKISILRREKGFTQDEFSNRLGVSAQAVSKWERGNSLPDIDLLPDIARILEVSIDCLLSNSEIIKEEMQSGNVISQDPLDVILPEIVAITIGYNVISIADEKNGGDLFSKIKDFRKNIARDKGILLPPIRIMDDLRNMKENEYAILFKGKKVGQGVVYPEKYMLISNGEKEFENIEGKEEIDPVYKKLKAKWISKEQREGFLSKKYQILSSTDIITAHFNQLVNENPSGVINLQTIKQLIDNVWEKYPAVVDEIVPNKVSYMLVYEVLLKLLAEKVCIRDMVTILETIAMNIDKINNIDELAGIVKSNII